MKKHYKQTAGLTQRLRQLGLTALLAGGATVAAHAQALNYVVAGATNVTTTYTDLGTNGTAITTSSTDDANSAAQSIGFTFSYNGTSFTQFVLNTNGLIRLGGSAPSAANMFYQNETGSTNPVGVDPVASTDAANVNLLLPFNFDLEAGSSAAEYRVNTTGTAPNRVCTIQWKNVRDKAATNAAQYANMAFQVKLYETSNQIEFVYSAPTAAATGAEIGRYATIGIKGSGGAVGQATIVNKPSSATPWSGATFISGDGTSVFFRRTVGFDAGRTFRFTQLAANDAAVNAIYTLGKVISPASLPHAVSARVTNAGSAALTNLAVTLSVTGANTFTNTQTVASLAAGASTTVTFAAYPATLTAGTNTVTVSVPADGDNANNSVAQSQLVGATTISYIDPTQTTTAGGVGFGVNAGLLLSKFTLSAARTVNSVSVFIADPNAVGRTVYGVVVSSAGAIVGRSPDYVVATADVNTYKTFAITTPPSVPVGDFYVGLAQTAFATAYFPVGTQTETPTRTGAFFVAPLAGGAAPTDVSTQGFGRFMIEAITSTTTSTSPELMRAVTVYPNPSATGVFNLAIAGANAQKGLEVEIVNTLGQRVFAGSARDNFTTTLDLSNLANGLYHLKVKNGEEYMQRQLSVVK
ncbi:MAG TPA: T9SS type A sorting domain-containing protein [Hymenobacter sp.]|uniref:T9SS type A sorting domain-containing protein n=1 Tax=Hymenobacter sp. TaxID=1898978 RepID=UPI002D7F1019|nr:T9SS type A sorting domain-containing protein [Hymenobacter sp.]HET9503364.1 T9SS type A sorting domain-containing protein [Hymenobacter sp.]